MFISPLWTSLAKPGKTCLSPGRNMQNTFRQMRKSFKKQNEKIKVLSSSPHKTLDMLTCHLTFIWLSPDHLAIIWPSPDPYLNCSGLSINDSRREPYSFAWLFFLLTFQKKFFFIFSLNSVWVLQLTGNAMTELISVAELSLLTSLDFGLKFQWASQKLSGGGGGIFDENPTCLRGTKSAFCQVFRLKNLSKEKWSKENFNNLMIKGKFSKALQKLFLKLLHCFWPFNELFKLSVSLVLGILKYFAERCFKH